MCGICGELNLRKGTVSSEHINRMMDSIKHRGPDDSGLFCHGEIGLGHRRLSIIDLSKNGKQPLWSNDGSLSIVFNGEVYNYKEIRADLLSRGYVFESETDTEVVINAIHCYGMEEAITKFIGMFAFAVWDRRYKKLYLCRDRAGIKPLYYFSNDKTFLFSSELKGLIAHPKFKKKINPGALGEFFVTGYFLDTHTVFEDTYKLSPGCYMEIHQSGVKRIHKYWDLDDIKRNNTCQNLETATEKLESLLIDSFNYRMVSDVPVGLFLSGGIDSSLVSSILKNKLNIDIHNITIGFNEHAFNEVPNAKRVSQELGVKHITHIVDVAEAQETLLKITDIYDEPFGDTSCIPTYILSKLSRQHVKVALSADGGDEQFCGYESYMTYLNYFKQVKMIPTGIRHLLSGFFDKVLPYESVLSRFISRSHGVKFRPQLIGRYEKMVELMKVNNLSDLLRLMNEKAWTKESVVPFLSVNSDRLFENTVLGDSYIANSSDEIIDRMMRNDYKIFLRDDILTKVDRASMAVSLECRDPMLDHRIAEMAFSLPMDFLYRNGEHKFILKQILRQYISEDITNLPKRGFMIPLYYWLRNEWKPIVLEYLSKSKVKSVGILDYKKVDKEVNRFYKFEGYRAEKIWMMLNFQMWAEKWYLN